MCVVLICPPKVRPSLETLAACESANPHGAGIAWRTGHHVEWVKSNNLAKIKKLADEKPGEIVIHFRIASVGSVCSALRHPFPVHYRATTTDRGRAGAVLFQNGTWGGYSEALRHAAREGFETPVGEMSDTRAAAFLVSLYGKKFLERLQPSRWVYFSHRETAKFGEWYQRGGIQFSNLHWERRSFHRQDDEFDAPEPQPRPHRTTTGRGESTRNDQEIGELWNVTETSKIQQSIYDRLPKPKTKARKHCFSAVGFKCLQCGRDISDEMENSTPCEG